MTNIQEGDRVRCTQGNIDKNLGEGLVGIAGGFARFSQYHGREVMVRFGNGEPHPADGWFWVSTVVRYETECADGSVTTFEGTDADGLAVYRNEEGLL